MPHLILPLASSLLILSVFERSGPPSQVPPELEAAEHARHSMLRTAWVEYSQREFYRETGGDAPRTRFYTWRAAEHQDLTIYHGDEERVLHRNADDTPNGAASGAGPELRLLNRGELWMRKREDPFVNVHGADAATLFHADGLRHLGLDPSAGWAANRERLLSEGRIQFTTRPDGELTLIVATVPGENGEFRWWIDPAKDYSVVRTQVRMDGNILGETRCTLRQVDGLWFPSKVEQWRIAAGDDLNGPPSKVTEVHHAEFNRPEHPSQFTPADIGLEPGMRVYRRANRSMAWDGYGEVPFDEFMARVAAGEVQPGPTVSRIHAQAQARAARQPERADPAAASQPASRPTSQPALSLRKFESEWERYTREFIARYRLNDEQAEKAWTICRDCQDQAQRYLIRYEQQIRELETNLRQPQAAPEQRARWQARVAELAGPLDQIFREQLQPRLEKLPTRAQRAAARP